MNQEGILDLGKFAVDRVKSNKEPTDIEKVNIISQIVEDPKFPELAAKGVSKLDSTDAE